MLPSFQVFFFTVQCPASGLFSFTDRAKALFFLFCTQKTLSFEINLPALRLTLLRAQKKTKNKQGGRTMRTKMKKVLMTGLAVLAVVTICFAHIQKEQSVITERHLDALATAYTTCEMY